jgi:hypothetical protein
MRRLGRGDCKEKMREEEIRMGRGEEEREEKIGEQKRKRRV